jgi:hypothetical protein
MLCNQFEVSERQVGISARATEIVLSSALVKIHSVFLSVKLPGKIRRDRRAGAQMNRLAVCAYVYGAYGGSCRVRRLTPF